ncbi:MAG TPA: serine protease [Pyrinomonadaceae bacterium]|nr:serine protease [Pyrinomonadaceae bacterium]
MGDAEQISEISMTQEQLEDLAWLLAKVMNQGNIARLAERVLGYDPSKDAANEVSDKEAFALKIVQALQKHRQIPYAVDLLLKDRHPSGRVVVGLRHILAGERLNSDNALQTLLTQHEPFISSADMIELLPKISRQVCAVALGTPYNKIVGSGFLVASDVVITNFHVVDPFFKRDPVTGQFIVDPVTGQFIEGEPGDQIYFFFDYMRAPTPNVPPTKGHSSFCVTAAVTNWLLRARKKLPFDGTTKSPKEVTDYELDYALIKLARPVGKLQSQTGGGPVRGWLPPEDFIDVDIPEKRIMVVQHPEMSPQMFDIGDYAGMDPSGTRVWYSVSTAKGSSGGAAVGIDGRLFALHNAEVEQPGGGKRVNQGVRIDLIAKDIAGVVLKEKVPDDDNTLIWSLNDDVKNSRPILGRSEFRRLVTEMSMPNAERALVVTGTPPAGLKFSIKLLSRILGTQVPVVAFSPAELEKSIVDGFLRKLISELNIGSRSGRKMPEPRPTEGESRWVRDVAQWLLESLLKDQELNPTKYPAWLVMNTVVANDQTLLWADHLKDLIAALLGVRDRGQSAIDVPQLRWLFLATPGTILPLGGVSRRDENLDNSSDYAREFAECYAQAYRSIDKDASLTVGALERIAKVELKRLEAGKAPRKLLADWLREIMAD